MTKKECLQILAIAKAAYPYFKIEDAEAMCQAWLMCLSEYDANNIVNALKIFLSEESEKGGDSECHGKQYHLSWVVYLYR